MDISTVPETMRISTNDVIADPQISICIPTWQDAATPLLTALAQMNGITDCEVLVYDDGSNDASMSAKIEKSLAGINAPATLITAAQNAGRSQARNRLVSRARADWLLLLDADMLPDGPEFLSTYLSAVKRAEEPALITGGFSLQQVSPTRAQALHAAQSLKSECLSAARRMQSPGRYVFTSNILVHRAILETVLFDDTYTGWGWEDVDWGLRVAERARIHHIENTATHLGLDEDATLIGKYAGSGQNFAQLARQHPEEAARMSLYKAAQTLRSLPGRALIRSLCRAFASARFLPLRLRLLALKTFRAAVYAEALS